MKFVKPLSVVIAALWLAGCAQKNTLPGLEDEVSLLETKQYIPRQAYDEKQMPVPYVALENPYLTQRGRVDKGSVLLFIEAKKALKEKDYKTAKAKLLVITGNDDSLAGPWVLMGEIAHEQAEYTLAVEYFQKAIAINPENVNAYTGLALTLRHMGRFKLAQNTLAESLRIWPDFPEAHLNIGVLYDVYLNKPELAQMHMEAFLFLATKDKADAESWFEEVKKRTGINTSFIDFGPQTAAEKQAAPEVKAKTKASAATVEG